MMSNDPNSALYWFPRIKEAGLPVPKTVLLPYDHREAMAALEGEGDLIELERICGVATQVATSQNLFPCFIRTDLACAKHSGPSAYLAESPERIPKVIGETIGDSEMKLWPYARPAALMLREFLELDSAFCAFGGLPIAREWRFFAGGEKVRCAHFYWPEDAIQFYDASEPSDWRERLARFQKQLPWQTRADLSTMAMKAAKACGGDAWSVDFAQDKSGKWWLLDMATMADSWHWPDCPNAPKEDRRIDLKSLPIGESEDGESHLIHNNDEGIETRG